MKNDCERDAGRSWGVAKCQKLCLENFSFTPGQRARALSIVKKKNVKEKSSTKLGGKFIAGREGLGRNMGETISVINKS